MLFEQSLAVILLQQLEKRAARARQMMGSPVGTVADAVPELQPALVAVDLIELRRDGSPSPWARSAKQRPPPRKALARYPA
jgi:hypothetical protein